MYVDCEPNQIITPLKYAKLWTNIKESSKIEDYTISDPEEQTKSSVHGVKEFVTNYFNQLMKEDNFFPNGLQNDLTLTVVLVS